VAEPLTVVIAGASGMIGSELSSQLTAAGHRVVRLVRRAAVGPDERQWDPTSGLLDADVINGVDAVVNLSGASISRLPWTVSYKKQILSSRLQATSTLATAIGRAAEPPAVFISGSAVGYYGDRPNERLDEDSEPGTAFLAMVVRAWEGAAQSAASDSTRVVLARTGLVLGSGGALTPLTIIARLFGAGPLGSGRQVWPWISLHDEAAAIVHLITASTLSGAVNLVAPRPVTATELNRTLAGILKRPFWLPAPRWAIVAALGDAGRELLLADQDVSAQRLTGDGFQFTHTDVKSALEAALALP
jgi:uncharacterized protein (TIGR01777 family)